MARSLYSKFVLGYLIFGLLSVLTIATFSSGITRDYLIKDRANALYDEANDIAASCSLMYQGQHQDMDLFSTQLKNVSTYLHTETWVVNKSGVVIMDSKNGSRVHTTIPDFDPTATGNRSYTIGTYYKLFDQNVLSVSAPVTGNYTTYGYVLIHLPISEIANSQSHILDILYMTCAIIFGLSLIILVVFTITVYLPLRKIAAGANEYAAGNLNYRIKVKTHDEMGYLSNTLNYMSDELNKMEEYQRNFIANVSHDFRSPLTSIKGYLEAILDGTIPPEMYEKYLSRVISETERLHKLTESMLTLNSLDAKGFLSRTNFDINRVIKDTTNLKEYQISITKAINVATDSSLFTQAISTAPSLFIVNGHEISADSVKMINPNKIETITILKDKYASILYGDKGKDGVVSITYTSGSPDKKVTSYKLADGTTIYLESEKSTSGSYTIIHAKDTSSFKTVELKGEARFKIVEKDSIIEYQVTSDTLKYYIQKKEEK